MKKIMMSALALAAFGTTIVGASPAKASLAYWQSSGWQPVGTYSSFSNVEGFAADYAVGSPIVSPGVTVSANVTSTISISSPNPAGNCHGTSCPTTHWAFTECSDGTYVSGNMILGFTVGGVGNESFTSNTGDAPWTGYWTGFFTAAGPDTGYCPSGRPQIAGGVWIYNY